MKIVVFVFVLAAALLTAGCASTRYTDAQNTAFRAYLNACMDDASGGKPMQGAMGGAIFDHCVAFARAHAYR